ncbi:MAG: DNA-directed RNA polymerase subunit omega [Candidatus Borkfalkiaceae bacterium]|nr:DNA-directed RNA polymerase subunit omega [Christensenellaceae bacterium]
MIHKPPIDELAKKTGSKYALCVAASKRARQIMDQAQNQGLTELPNKEKPLSVAAQEIYDGKVVVTDD